MTNDFPFKASFRMYNQDGIDVSFTVAATAGLEHIVDLHEYMSILKTKGYSPQLPGLEPGEETQEIDGWVYGETSRDEPCVYLYKTPLKWKVATVYVESLEMLPFPVGGKQWPGGAPERETAVNKGYLNQCAPFKVVMVPTGKTSESGHNIMRFNRVLDEKPLERVNKSAPPVGTRQAPQNANNFDDLPSETEFKAWYKALPDGGQEAYKATDAGSFMAALSYIERYEENPHAAKNALEKFVSLEAVPFEQERNAGKIRVLYWQRVHAYAMLRNAGMNADKAQSGALSQVVTT